MNRSDDATGELLKRWYAVRALLALEWLPAILVALTRGPKHYSELLHEADELHLTVSDWSGGRHARLHESTLTRALKQLTEDGLIERHEEREPFITAVCYSLTPAAAELIQALQPLAGWAHEHDELIRHAYGRRHWSREDDARQ